MFLAECLAPLWGNGTDFPGESSEWDLIWREIRAVSPSFLIIDPVGAAFAGPVNELAPTRAFMRTLCLAAESCSTAVLLIVHSTKAARAEGGLGPGSVSGSAAWRDAARAVLHLSMFGADREFRVVKCNHGRKCANELLANLKRHVLLKADPNVESAAGWGDFWPRPTVPLDERETRWTLGDGAEWLAEIDAAWIASHESGHEGKHPLGPLVQGWWAQLKPAERNGSAMRILPGGLAATRPSGRLFAPMDGKQAGDALPGFKAERKSPALPLALYDLGVGDAAERRGRGALPSPCAFGSRRCSRCRCPCAATTSRAQYRFPCAISCTRSIRGQDAKTERILAAPVRGGAGPRQHAGPHPLERSRDRAGRPAQRRQRERHSPRAEGP